MRGGDADQRKFMESTSPEEGGEGMLRGRGPSKVGDGLETRQEHMTCSKGLLGLEPSTQAHSPQGLTPSSPDTPGPPFHTLAVRS